MNIKNNYLAIICSLLIVATGTVSCSKKDENSLAGKKAKLTELEAQASKLKTEIDVLRTAIDKLDTTKIDKSKSVVVSPIVSSNFNHFVEASGRIEAENNIFASPQMGGSITKVYVKIGDFVNKGQRIATIDNSILRNSIQEIQLQLETAKTIFERQKNLWDQKIGTEIQYIQAKASVESLEKRIATLKTQDGMNIVTAPISGVIDEVRLKEGEMAAPGLGIVRIVNFNNLKVVASIPDTYAGTIAKGDVIEVKFPDLQKEIKTTISYVSQTINPASRTFLVEAKIPGTDKTLKPNLMAVININDQSTGSAISIAEDLIQNTEQGSLVYVVENIGNKKVAKSKIVTLGLKYNGRVEIKSGLSNGDLLITEGFQNITDGQLVSY